MDYITECNLALLKCEKSKLFLKNQRGLYGDTLSLGIGIDKTKKVWIFPCFDIQTRELFGAEYRTSQMILIKEKRIKGCTGLTKEPGTSARLCTINNVMKPEKLIITEGFIDAYTLWQILNEQERTTTEVCTPSNGVGTIKALLGTIPVNKYSKIIFFLDSDDAGEQARDNIRKAFKANYAFKKIECNCCKDINQYYLTHNRKAV
jgi:5S rRNA maturation endonuclease (ribonuclease M5)